MVTELAHTTQWLLKCAQWTHGSIQDFGVFSHSYKFLIQKIPVLDQNLGHNIFWRNLTQNIPGGYVRRAQLWIHQWGCSSRSVLDALGGGFSVIVKLLSLNRLESRPSGIALPVYSLTNILELALAIDSVRLKKHLGDDPGPRFLTVTSLTITISPETPRLSSSGGSLLFGVVAPPCSPASPYEARRGFLTTKLF